MSVAKRPKKIRVTETPKITAWSLFVEEMKPKIMKEKGGISKLQLYQELSEEWAKQNDVERSGYEERAERKTINIKRHQKRNPARNSSDSDRETKGISAYSLFVADKQNEIKIKHPKFTLSERTKIVTQLWRTLSQKEKQLYLNKAKCANRKLNKVSSDEDGCYSVKIHRKSPVGEDPGDNPMDDEEKDKNQD
jgi:hypothetical protein